MYSMQRKLSNFKRGPSQKTGATSPITTEQGGTLSSYTNRIPGAPQCCQSPLSCHFSPPSVLARYFFPFCSNKALAFSTSKVASALKAASSRASFAVPAAREAFRWR